MALALIVLAAGSVLAGYGGLPHALGGSNRLERFLHPVFEVRAAAATAGTGAVAEEALADGGLREGETHAEEALELGLMGVSTLVALGGIAIAALLFLYRREAAAALAARFSGLYRLLLNKYYVDEVYDAALVQPIRILSEEGLWKGVDAGFIDGSVNGLAGSVGAGGEFLRRIQTGSIRAYAVSLALGAVAVLGYWLW
jgi:NADH-quinone oxidoreductase subunit L